MSSHITPLLDATARLPRASPNFSLPSGSPRDPRRAHRRGLTRDTRCKRHGAESPPMPDWCHQVTTLNLSQMSSMSSEGCLPSRSAISE